MAAQVLSGTVSDKRTDEPLLSATVGISGADGKMQYTATDMKGIFEFKNIKSGDYTLQISYVGYKTYTKNISVPQSGASIEIFMEEDVQSILRWRRKPGFEESAIRRNSQHRSVRQEKRAGGILRFRRWRRNKDNKYCYKGMLSRGNLW